MEFSGSHLAVFLSIAFFFPVLKSLMYLWQLGVAGGYPGCRARESGNAELRLHHPTTPALLLSALTIHGRGAGSKTKPTEHFKRCYCSPHVMWLHRPSTAVLCSAASTCLHS